MPKASGAPNVGDLIIFNGPTDDPWLSTSESPYSAARLVIDTDGIRILVTSPWEDWPYQWVRRDCVRIINADR